MIGVIGGGAWGTAIAQVMAAGGVEVRLWAREAEVIDSVNGAHENSAFLAGIPLSPLIRATSDLGELGAAELIFVVTPAQFMRSVLADLPQTGAPLILCSKGIEAGSLKLLHQVAHEAVPGSPIAVCSGPTFAHEVAKGLPTAVTLAADDLDTATRISQAIARPTFRPYVSTDVAGAEIGGAVKNVLAIACGVVEGAGLGLNARAALIARGFAEMTRFGVARGAQPETLAGLSGLGDLVLTCSSTNSRNFSLGVGLGQGRSAKDLLADRRTVAEGAATAPVLREAAAQAGVEMPVAEAVCALLSGADVRSVVGSLLARPLRKKRCEMGGDAAGINLGKRTLLKGDMLAAAEALGYADAKTLLASGNLVFDAGKHSAEAIGRDLHDAIAKATGIKSDVFLRSKAQLAKVIEANPFPEVARERPSQLLVLFHGEAVPHAEVARIVEAHDGPERLKAVGHELFIDYPEGMGRSTLERTMAKVKPKLPVGTGRNWNTVGKLYDLL